MNVIVAVDQNWGIGKDGALLTHIPDDLKFFKEKTMGKVVVMGRKTFLSLPGAKPLPGRTNIVLTTDPSFQKEGIVCCSSQDALFSLLNQYALEDIFFIGGEQIYRTFLPYCSTAYITKIHAAFPADVFFPNLDEISEWKQTAAAPLQSYKNISFSFELYQQKK